MRDSDLWVMDAQTGALTNLTDDGFDAGILLPKEVRIRLFVDLAPAWTPDGQAITFSRTLGIGGDLQ